MRLLDTRTLCVALLVFCTANGCAARRGMHRLGQCGQGHSSLLDYAVCKMDSRRGRTACDDGMCDDGCYQRTTPPPPPQPMHQDPGVESESGTAPSAPPPPMVTRDGRPVFRGQIVSPRRRWYNRMSDSLKFSIPLPTRWIGRTEVAPEITEPMTPANDIPWHDAPIAAAQPEMPTHIAEETRVVGYEYRQPVGLSAPEFTHPAVAQPARLLPTQTGIASGHSVFSDR